MPTDDWAKNLADFEKRKLELDQMQKEKDLSDRKMLDANADAQWVEVRQAFAKCIEAFNQEMQSKYISLGSQNDYNLIIFKIENRNSGPHHVRFDRPRWTIIVPSEKTLTLTVIPGNGVVWMDRIGSKWTAEEIARNEIQAALKM